MIDEFDPTTQPMIALARLRCGFGDHGAATSAFFQDRSFRFRLLAVALFLAMGFSVAFITSWGVHALLRSLPLPNGMIPGEWALLTPVCGLPVANWSC